MDEFRKTYSLADVAKHIGKQRTTINNWVPIFKPYLPTVGTGKSKRYMQSALEIFSLISRMKDASEPNELIIDAIKNISKEVMVEDEEDHQPKPLYNDIIDSFREMSEILEEQNNLLVKQGIQREREFNELKEMFMLQSQMIKDMQDQNLTSNNEVTKKLDEDSEARKREIKERDDRLMKSLTALTKSTEETKTAIEATAVTVSEAASSEEKKKPWYKLKLF